MTYKIFIIEDDDKISELLSEYMKKYGYDVYLVKDFNKILEEFEEIKPHLVLMDINLPKFDGYFWCNKIRKYSLCPIIFISARNSEMNQVMAIESGGDDYITKPFYYEVVLAKIKSQLRRVYGEYSSSNTERIIELDGLILYPERLTVEFNKKTSTLSKKEEELLEYLMCIYPKVAARDSLLERLWDDQNFVDENTLNVNITRVRKKLSELSIVDCIETVRGSGYKLNITWRNS